MFLRFLAVVVAVNGHLHNDCHHGAESQPDQDIHAPQSYGEHHRMLRGRDLSLNDAFSPVRIVTR